MEMYEQSRLQTIDLPSGDLVFLFDENDRLNSVSTSSTERLLEEEERRSKHQKRTSQQFAEFLNFEEI